MAVTEANVQAGGGQLSTPILVTGAPRSGTTWVGKMLALSDQVHYLSEPFNPDHPLDAWLSQFKASRYMTYVSEEMDGYRETYYLPLQNLIARQCGQLQGFSRCRSPKALLQAYRSKKEFLAHGRQGKPALLKDPIASMSAGWLARTFGARVVVMIRHPAGVVASMKRLNWSFEPRNWALSQPLLLRDYLAPFETELAHVSETNADIIDRLALLWKVVYYVVTKYREQYPDWLYVRHEDVANDPIGHFEAMYRRFGLEFSDRVRRRIDDFSNARNPSHNQGRDKTIKLNSKKVVGNWKQSLSADDIRRIRDRVEPVARFFYGDADWDLSSSALYQ
jgi:hypothetical protein